MRTIIGRSAVIITSPVISISCIVAVTYNHLVMTTSVTCISCSVHIVP
jgi:hypothetical protein